MKKIIIITILVLFFSGCASLKSNPEKFEATIRDTYEVTYHLLNAVSILFPGILPVALLPIIGQPGEK